MSTGLECDIIGHEGKWYYTLQDGNCPVSAWDWREYSTTYGPFGSSEQAQQHLRDNHANPGGYSLVNFDDGEDSPSEQDLKCIAEAESPRRGNGRYFI